MARRGTTPTVEADEVAPKDIASDTPTASTSDVSQKISALMEQVSSIRQDAQDKVHTLERELEKARHELAQVDRLMGNQDAVVQRTKAPMTRVPKGHWKAEVFRVLEGKPDGLTRGEIIKALNLIDDDKGQANLSNALGSMKKAGEVGQNEGRYTKA